MPVRIEEEPGSSGKIVIDHYARHVLPGRDFRGVRSSGNKPERARPLAAAMSNGLVSLRSEAPWVRDLVNEMRSFPLGTHDDQVDGMSGAMTALTQQDRVQSVLPRSMVQLCVDAYRKYEREIGRIVAAGRPFVGFRVAETGADHTSMVTRIGPVIRAAEQWDEAYTATLERVDRHCRTVGVLALYCDAGGSGAGIRTNMRQMWRERLVPQYPVIGVNFGAAVEGGNTEFVRGQTNAQYFARRSSQLGWSLRLRAVRTKRLMEGEDIDLSTCLVITPAIEGLERFLAQLSQPEFDETSTGKVEIPTSTACAGIRLTGAMLPWLRTWPWWWALQRSRIWGAGTGMPAWTGAPWIMLHGFGANMQDLAGLAPAIESEGYVYACPNAPIPFNLGLGQEAAGVTGGAGVSGVPGSLRGLRLQHGPMGRLSGGLSPGSMAAGLIRCAITVGAAGGS